MSIERLRKLNELQHAAGTDCVAIVPGANMLYFTGIHYHLGERPIIALLPADPSDRPALVVPAFEAGKAMHGPVQIDWRVYSYLDGQDLQEVADLAVRELKLDGKVIGVEPTQMRVLESGLLSHQAANARFVSAADLLKQMRMTKDADEISRMRRAAKVPERVLAEAIKRIKPGMTEREVAGLFMMVSFEQNPQEPASPPLVQTGLSAAFPHAFAGERAVQRGDLMVVDFGAVVDSYGSDITRTIAIGEPGDEMKHVYEIVKQANAAGRAAVRPGILAEDVDHAAREVIERAGYGPYFTHRTGHGLGLEGHEAPYMVKGDKTVLQPGMTFTVEPGIYIEGKGGVRIEDDMVVTTESGESLTTFSRDLIVV
ncbi:MAG: Xaa-Pro peptidase family protein [Chloroflexi bacterium]|nr:Xaa-Pro peptidase family protein [Chloroflexota bacterium]